MHMKDRYALVYSTVQMGFDTETFDDAIECAIEYTDDGSCYCFGGVRLHIIMACADQLGIDISDHANVERWMDVHYASLDEICAALLGVSMKQFLTVLGDGTDRKNNDHSRLLRRLRNLYKHARAKRGKSQDTSDNAPSDLDEQTTENP